MKITIYVPDKLGRQLAARKEEINVSAVCQEALIAALDLAPSSLGELYAAWERVGA